MREPSSPEFVPPDPEYGNVLSVKKKPQNRLEMLLAACEGETQRVILRYANLNSVLVRENKQLQLHAAALEQRVHDLELTVGVLRGARLRDDPPRSHPTPSEEQPEPAGRDSEAAEHQQDAA
jgi:hypothetical protein